MLTKRLSNFKKKGIKDISGGGFDVKALILIDFLLISGFIINLIFNYFVSKKPVFIIGSFAGIAAAVSSLSLMSITKKIKISSTVTLFSIVLISVLLFINGLFFTIPSFIIMFCIPQISLYYKGYIKGLIWLAGYLVLAGLFAVFSSRLKIPSYYPGKFVSLITGYITLSILSYLYELNRNFNNNLLLKQLHYHNVTKLPNRHKLMEDLKEPIRWFILICLDDFKEINDFFGNKIGDLVLIETSERLKLICRKDPRLHLYHLHGDEFAITSLDDLNVLEVEALCTIMYQTIAKEVYRINEHEINLNVTIGISNEKNNIISSADIALKYSKRKNRTYVFYDDSIKTNQEYVENLKWSIILKKAIADDRIIPYFQPIVNARNGRIEKYECLARLVDLDGKIVPPYFFLNAAKKFKLYSSITRKMITKCFNYFADKPYEFSINLSLEDIMDAETINFIIENLKKFNIGDRIVFELLESEGIENYEQILEFIEIVKSYGCKIAIDDFGSGYSNIDHIIRLNVDYLKIDGSLIRQIDQFKNNQIIVKNIVEFSRELNIKTISEFVHSENIHKWVKYLNVDYEQGYFWGEPSPDTQEKT